MGTSQAPKLTPVEEQQLVGEVLFLRAKVEEVAAWIGPLRQANTAWAAANAELRAYKERTEAGLVALCRLPMRGWFKECLQAKSIGLWRDPPQAEVQP